MKGAKWPDVSLSDVCSLITDGTHHSPPNGPLGDFKYVTAKNIKVSGLDLRDLTYVSADVHEEIYRRCPAEKGDVLYIKDGVTTGIATVNTLDEPFSMLSSVALLKPIGEILSPRFLAHWLNSPKTFSKMTGNMTGSAIRRLVLKQIREAKLALPPVAEQHRIVEKIDTLFARSTRARDELTRIPRLIERYRQAVLSAFFDEAEHEADKSVTLEQVALSVRNGLSRKPEDTPPGVRILRISAVRVGRVVTDDHRYYRPADGEDIGRYILSAGDLLFVRFNGNAHFVGVCGVFSGADAPYVYPDKLIRVRLDEEAAAPAFVEAMYSTPEVRNAMHPFIKTAAGQHGISGGDLKAITFPLPPLPIQQRLTARLHAQLDVINAVLAEIERAMKMADRLDQSILDKAFAGKLVPQDPADEPASELLARIKAARAEAPTPKRGRKPKG